MTRIVFVEVTYRSACESTGTAISLTLQDKIVEELVRNSLREIVQPEDVFILNVVSAEAPSEGSKNSVAAVVELDGYVDQSLLSEQVEFCRALTRLLAPIAGLEVTVGEILFVTRPNPPMTESVPKTQPA